MSQQPWIKFYPRDWRADQARLGASLLTLMQSCATLCLHTRGME